MARRKVHDGFDSPEGRTQHCPACEAGAHVCGRREITDVEREFLYHWIRIDQGKPYSAAYVAAQAALRKSREAKHG